MFLYWLRQASYVSTRFRHELGGVLWVCTGIDTEFGDTRDATDREHEVETKENYQEVRDFLAGRPAVCAGVKFLNVKITIFRFGEAKSTFGSWCEAISDKLELLSAKISVEVDRDDVLAFLKGEKRGPYGLDAATNLRISHSFEVTLEK